MMNSESHRQFYLAAAGIRMWYARRPLPAAAPSPEYQFADDDELPEQSVVPEQTIRARPPELKPKQGARPARHAAVDLQALMAPTVDKEKPPKPVEEPSFAPPAKSGETSGESPGKAPGEIAGEASGKVSEKISGKTSEEAPTETVSEAANQPVISAYLGIWSTEKYLLISQWSGEASERLQDSLARNLLSALGQNSVGERQMFCWPVFRNPQIPGSSPDDLQKVLSGLLSPFQDRSVILLGVLNDGPQAQREYCLQSVFSRVGVDFLHSLAELSATPAHKRDLWNALKSCYQV